MDRDGRSFAWRSLRWCCVVCLTEPDLIHQEEEEESGDGGEIRLEGYRATNKQRMARGLKDALTRPSRGCMVGSFFLSFLSFFPSCAHLLGWERREKKRKNAKSQKEN